MPVQVLHGIRSNANSLRAILPPPIPPRRVHRLWRHNFRFVLLLLGFLLCTSLSINANLFNFTTICLEPGPDDINDDVEQPHSWLSKGKFEQRELLMWAMALGTLLASLPSVHLYSHFGARHVLFWAAILSTFATALTPLATFNGFWALSAVRFAQGIAYAADFAALGMLCAQWASLDEHGLFLSAISSYSPASISIGNSLSGLFCSSPFGWPAVYYLCSLVCFLIALAWFALYSDQPRLSSHVSPKELELIEKGKSAAHVDMESKRDVPYLPIFCSGLVWVCWLNAFVDLVSAMFLVQYKPLYFRHVLGYGIFDTGWLTALPSALHIPLKLVFGMASDRIKFISERHKLILFNSIAVGLPGISYIGIAFAPSPLWAFLFFVSVSICLSAAGGGFYKCATLTSRQFGHLVMAGIQMNKCLALFVGPALISLLVHDLGDQHQWHTIFLLFAALCLIANLLFCLIATDQPAEFTLERRKVMAAEEEAGPSGMMAKKSCCHFSIGEE